MKLLAPRGVLIAIISLGTIALLVYTAMNRVEKKGGDDLSPAEVGNSTEALSAESAPPGEIPAKTTSDEIKVSAAGAYLMATGDPLYSFRNEKQWPIASITKLMTAFTARKLIPGTEIVTMDEEAVAAAGAGGDFKPGERFTAADLTRAMLVGSSNDAAVAITDHYGADLLVGAMNELAVTIGMTNTTFADTTGVSPRNLGTPNDLSRLVQFIWAEDPEIFSITRLKAVTIVDIDAGRSRKLMSTNLFAGRSDFLGGKTGQIPDSSGNLVSIFSLPDKSSPVIIIVLGAQDRFQETEKILTKL